MSHPLEGKKVVKVRPITTGELMNEGWDHDIQNMDRGSWFVIELEGFIDIYAMRDVEGNGPGVLTYRDRKEGKTFYVASEEEE